jgi:hypothetical protein
LSVVRFSPSFQANEKPCAERLKREPWRTSAGVLRSMAVLSVTVAG